MPARRHRAVLIAVPGAPFGIPGAYLQRAAITTLVVDLLALVSIWRSRNHSLKAKLVWTAVVVLVPVVGALAWLILGRERRERRRAVR